MRVKKLKYQSRRRITARQRKYQTHRQLPLARHRLTYYRWERADSVRADYWTAWTISVYAPTYERPHVSVLLSVANGGGKCLSRWASVASLQQLVIIPPEGIERLRMAETRAIEMVEAVQQDMRVLYEVGHLPPGVELARTDTGEVISQAERIIDGHTSN